MHFVMDKKGFEGKWRRWMEGCFLCVLFVVLVNVKAKGWVKASRELRRGGLVEPFLGAHTAECYMFV